MIRIRVLTCEEVGVDPAVPDRDVRSHTIRTLTFPTWFASKSRLPAGEKQKTIELTEDML